MRNIDFILNSLLSLITGLIIIFLGLFLPIYHFQGDTLLLIFFFMWILFNQRNVWEEEN